MIAGADPADAGPPVSFMVWVTATSSTGSGSTRPFSARVTRREAGSANTLEAPGVTVPMGTLSRLGLLLLAALALALPFVLEAQRSDVLVGRVTGPDGLPVPAARVVAVSVETEIVRPVVTGEDGRYLILFPDGGGAYILRVSSLGMAEWAGVVLRQGDQELLLTNVRLEPQAIPLEGLVVEVLRDPGAGRTAEESLVLGRELLEQLPLRDLDPATLALLAAGVVAAEPDSLTGDPRFSLGGMREELNQVLLDGVSQGETPLGVPEEGVRQVEVTTSTFDASRGGFAGGQVAVTTARGNNRRSGSLSYRLDDDALQLRASPVTNAFTRQNLGGSYGGPIVQDRIFYNVSFQFTRNTNYRFALSASDPQAEARTGVAADSVARFLDLLSSFGAFPVDGQTGAYRQLSDDLRLQGRVDWNVVQDRDRAHTLSLRYNTNLHGQDSTRINTLDLFQHGGTSDRNQHSAALNLTSRVGRNWTHSMDLSFLQNWTDAVPFIAMPQGQVRITSNFDDGTRSSRTLTFGGNRNMPTEAFSREYSFSNELSFVLPVGEQVHRIKTGVSVERSSGLARSTDNLFGSFRFASLQDFADNRPDRYERTLTEREAGNGRFNLGFHLGNTWRVSQPLEVTLGVRLDRSGLLQRPEYNPAVEAAFGRRTDIIPQSMAMSPRLGVSYQLPAPPRQRRSLSGGIGYFAGRTPTNIFSTAIRQTGMPSAEQRLLCIGSAVPVPDWTDYLEDLDLVPVLCAEGEPGSPQAQSSRAPTVTLIDPNQSLPGSLRVDLGYRTPLPGGLTGDFRFQHATGRGLWGYRDLNLDEATATPLGDDGRLFFGDPAGIVPRSGTVSLATSRADRDFAHVYDVTSTLRSVSNQISTRISGELPLRVRSNVNYTLAWARDQGSGSLQAMTTAGNPNEVEWATASNDRRHTLSLSFTRAFTSSLEVTADSRITSGAPFTPLVNRDINGDGLRNDRAFVHDPAVVADSALAAGMRRVFDGAPGRVRRCLEQQFGQVAARNSCRNGWTQSLNFRANYRPQIGRLDRRTTITADFRNVLTGLDLLLHGRDDMRGWGEGQRADANLLEVRRFDPTTGNFRYEVNEGFGRDNRGPNAFRNAFSLTISARMTLGPGNAGRAFSTGAPAGGGRGAQGGLAGQGGQGRTGAQGAENQGSGEADDQGGNLTFRELATHFEEAESAEGVLAYLVQNPLQYLLAMEELALTVDQRESLEEMAGALEPKLAEARASLTPVLDSVAPAFLAKRGTEPARVPGVMASYRGVILPATSWVRREVADAWESALAALTPEQRERLDTAGDAARISPPAPTLGTFDAILAVDRMLANPLAVLIMVAPEVGLNADEIRQLQALSDTLRVHLDTARNEIGQRFDGLDRGEQAAMLQQVLPEIAKAREAVVEALTRLKAILAPEVWTRIPLEIREPYGPSSEEVDPESLLCSL